MHFTILYLMKDKDIDDVGSFFEESFGELYCDGCGEREPDRLDLCDWFVPGGRWAHDKILVDKRGNSVELINIKDLSKEIPEDMVYGIVGDSDDNTIVIPEDGFGTEANLQELLFKINNKKIEGMVALMDCHM